MAALRVGLTGGVGSGKSTVGAMLQAHGAAVIDADALVHELTGPDGAALPALRAEFGDDMFLADGMLDRAALRLRVFADDHSRRRLEGVLHPRVRALAEARAKSAEASAPYVVLMIPLLVEAGEWRSRVDRVLVIDCSEATQIARVMRRPGLDEAAARSILAAQATRAQRLAAADDVVFNEAPLEHLGARVARLHASYLRGAPTAAAGGV
jgi:dephospho-CoA kinase